MKELEGDVENLEGTLRRLDSEETEKGSQSEATTTGADPLDISLEDTTNATRSATAEIKPRRAPDARSRKLDQEKKGEEFDNRQKISVKRDHSLPPQKSAVFGNHLEAHGTNKLRPILKENQKPPKRIRKQQKREARAKKHAEKAAEVEQQRNDHKQEAFTPNREGGLNPERLSFDDLDMENPLPEAAYAPGKDHTGLVLDRRQRRVEAAIRAEMNVPDEDWEQKELTETEALSPDRKFNLPVYLAKAVLVTLAGALVVLGGQIALQGFRDAERGQEMKEFDETPGLKAIGILEAQTVMKSFLRAPNWETKLKFVRNPESAKSRMETFYAHQPDGSIEYTKVTNHNYNALEGGEGHLFTLELSTGESINLPVVRFEQEAPFFVVDWEAFVDYSDQNWQEFVARKKPGSSGIFRVYAAEDDYYAWQFSDSARYLGMQVYDKERTAIAYAYIRRGTVNSREIRANLLLWKNRHEARRPPYVKELPPWIPKPPDWAPMVIEVRFPERIEGAVPQVEVVRFISSNWVLSLNQ